ncbi:hypothetical protein BZA77DRAFT_25943 [Pyronema omphalodes]|nr:hypothetical protein BZA77DRAFT_25943 [Pyronema omphalodes]
MTAPSHTEAAAAETTPLLSSNSVVSKKPVSSTTPHSPAFLLAPCNLTDTPQMASIAASAYLPSALTRYLSPNAYTYLIDYIRGFDIRIRYRMLSSHSHAYKAYHPSNPVTVLGYIQYLSPYPRDLQPFWQRWLFKVKLVWESLWFRDRSADLEAVRIFMKYDTQCKELMKEGREYFVQSLVVSPGMQRKGIGRALLMPLLMEAEKEGRRVWLEASPEGEAFYASLGFRLREKFDLGIDIGETGGGIMVWEPSWLKDEEDEEEMV